MSSKNTYSFLADISIAIYQSGNNTTQINVKFGLETVWINQEQLAALFQRGHSIISKHIRNIFNRRKIGERKQYAKNTYCKFR